MENMDIVIDTSALIAVIVDEPERDKIINLTAGNTLIGPGSIPWEIGNAFSSMFKQNKVNLDEANKGLIIFSGIPIRFVETDFFKSISLAKQVNIYAYDAYILDCALKHSAPLLTLDRRLKQAAQGLGIKTLEV
jgi:predicted nucleic acid-binding protein